MSDLQKSIFRVETSGESFIVECYRAAAGELESIVAVAEHKTFRAESKAPPAEHFETSTTARGEEWTFRVSCDAPRPSPDARPDTHAEWIAVARCAAAVARRFEWQIRGIVCVQPFAAFTGPTGAQWTYTLSDETTGAQS